MFELDGQKSWVDAQPSEVVYLAASINRPAVAPPDRSPEAAQAYLCTLRQNQGHLVYIYLHLVSSNTGLLYRWSEGAVSPDLVESLQQNAYEFTESMGFMMDDLRFADQAPDQQAETFARTPLFHQDISFLKSEDESMPELEIVESEDGENEEVLIEAVEENPEAEPAPVPQEAPAEPAESEVEEITLDVMSSDEIEPGIAESAAEPPAAALAEEEIVLGGTLAESSQAEEDILLDQLKIKEESPPSPPPMPEPAPEPVAEAASVAEAEAVPETETGEIEVGVEEEDSSALLEALEVEAEEAPPLPAPPAPAAEPAPAPHTRAAAAPEEEIGEDDHAFLVRLLAMM